MGSHSFLQGIFPSQGSNSGLPHCRQIPYHLSHQGSWLWNASVQFSCSVMFDFLQPHGPQHARPPCPLPQTPIVYPNSCPLSWWCHRTISSSVIPFSSCLQSFLAIRVFSNESALRITWPKYWSFSFNLSPSNEHSRLISCRMDW